jgi:hypothetical protein
MIDFLFLGIIPGTNTQITFEMWLTAFTVFASTWLISYALLKVHPLRQLRLITTVYFASWQAKRLNQQA